MIRQRNSSERKSGERTTRQQRRGSQWTRTSAVAAVAAFTTILHPSSVAVSAFVPASTSSLPHPLIGRTRSSSSSSSIPFIPNSKKKRLTFILKSSSSPNDNDNENEKLNEDTKDTIDDLYEFLTRRQNNQNPKKQQQNNQNNTIRKRDRILNWMSSTKKTPTAKIQPIPIDDDTNNTNNEILKTDFSTLFDGMPSLNDILSDESNPNPSTKKQQQDDSWFDDEKDNIINDYNAVHDEMISDIQNQRTNNSTDNIPENAEGIIGSIIQQELDQTLQSQKNQMALERLHEYEESLKLSSNDNDKEESTKIADQILKEAQDSFDRSMEMEQNYNDFQLYYEAQQDKLRGEDSDGGGTGNDGVDRTGTTSNDDTTIPRDLDDLDQWALESLQRMLDKRADGDGNASNRNEGSSSNEDGVDEMAVADILEDTIEDLKVQIEKEAKKGKIRPDTMKEWQMYRSIATRNIEETKIAQQLESWKLYVEEEEKSRQQFGLSDDPSRPKMPFNWNKRSSSSPSSSSNSKIDFNTNNGNESTASSPSSSPSSQKDMRKEMNEQAIQALQDLIRKTKDPIRSEKLQKEVDFLYQAMESDDQDMVYGDDDSVDNKMSAQPVDLSDVFGQSSDDDEGSAATATASDTTAEVKNPILQTNPPFDEDTTKSASQISASYENSMRSSTSTSTPSPPPNTPFFQENDTSSTYYEESYTDDAKAFDPPPPPPNTPFFQNDDEDADNAGVDDASTAVEEEPAAATTTTSDNNNGGGYNLGTLEEQKLRAMYQRAGARTTEEKEKIKAGWLEFQQFETDRRQKSGLSETESETKSEDDGNSASLKYDIDDVMSQDGDVDAEKILATIGPRPTRSPKQKSVPTMTTTASTTDDVETTRTEGATSKLPESTVKPEEVSESLFRSVAAVGGGRTKDDPSLKEAEKADFEAYLEKQNAMRKKLDMEIEEVAEQSDVRIDDDGGKYAKEALDSIGPRPTFVRKPRRGNDFDAGEFSDRGGALASREFISDDDEEDEDDDDDDYDNGGGFNGPAGSSDGTEMEIPEWLRKEREELSRGAPTDISSSFLGSEIDEMFDDNKYEHNQRQLADYQRRRAGETGPMGIDINDALGRGRGSDDYADYTYDAEYFRSRDNGWGANSFKARKAHLLDYTELSTVEVNNLLEHKNSVYATGVSQYMPRINKPFKEFGAILRLEGVVVDITGLEYKAWTTVAEKLNLRLPTVEDARRASVAKSDVAVRDVFYWTKDWMESKEIAYEHDVQFQKVFDEWAQQNGIQKPTKSHSPKSGNEMALGAMEIAEDDVDVSAQPLPKAATSEQERLSSLKAAWEETARIHNFQNPPYELIVQSSVLTPDIVVQSIFRWSTDANEIDKIVATYRQAMQGKSKTNDAPQAQGASRGTSTGITPSLQNEPIGMDELDETDMLELQYIAWCEIAEEIGVEAPEPDAVLAASVLNDAALVILQGFEWTEDIAEAQDLSARFQKKLTEVINDQVHGRNVGNDVAASANGKSSSILDSTSARPKEEQPSKEQNAEATLQEQVDAWAATAAVHDFASPSIDQIELTMKMKPDESVRRLLAWTYNFNDKQIRTISATYEDALKGSLSSSASSSTSADEKEAKAGDTVAVNNTEQPPAIKPSGLSEDEIFKIAFDAWTDLAWKRGLSLPNNDAVIFAMTVGPEQAILNGFGWASTPEDAAEIAKEYRDQIAKQRSKWQSATASAAAAAEFIKTPEPEIPPVTVVSGVHEWIKSLRDVEMGCGITSHLTDEQVEMLLDFAALKDSFPAEDRVTANSRYDADSQQLLGVALRIERRPDQCIAFDTTPYAATAAQDVDMRAVAFVGPYPRYDLLAADTSAVAFTELTAMNIRRLFGERIYDQPQLDMVQAQPKPAPKVLTRFWDDD
eukprot:CAMPEP_0119555704 /NCGR_PEP_ID=MMETSP1352-20130426/7825_1 /TAXON_ID=265584 /ORGANISM="Stauroneis constricta, Strain CCMP1120" /LENGTH=1890 /DNA_ID=CAMNT_0007602513 /DNA_START=159 /DNA_END=5831 /DNA_ORIENTATION=-